MALKKTLITPRAAAVWPHLNGPDTKWKAEGQYHSKLRFEVDDPKWLELKSKLEAIRDAKYQEEYDALVAAKKKARADQLKKVEVGNIEVDEDSGEETGFVTIKVAATASGVTKAGKSWRRSVPIFNSQRKELKNPPRISGGSILRCEVEPFAYLSEKDKEIGVSLRLESVQIISLVSGGARSADERGFEEEDGDDIEDEAATGAAEGGDDADGDDDL
ncbi:hypothetical protein EOE18_14740 [Novosphingobium umbonatum]|uniref:Single-stranded DNA-binding protein BPT7 domain-containing protein n=1 Tax=Novosphingobium umbonatum TaxID=1908524 RepID=A0A437N0W8_9SPHN|nr:hypothetical protein [Novosphingobium umbonatum]RVU03577.1 hypothetical protein EOE18_14740 [Novosphingobium umbonatum]